MSLDTVLKIGRSLRQTENSLKYFKYVEPCPKDKDGNSPLCLTIPVRGDYSFDLDNIKITPEKERDNLYYLLYATSNNDSSPKKYFFGDIYYSRKNEIGKDGNLKGAKDYGNYTLVKGKGDAYENGKSVFAEILKDVGREKFENTALFKFHKNFGINHSKVKSLLLHAPAIVDILSNNKAAVADLLQDEIKLKDTYVKTVLEKHLDRVKKVFQKDEKLVALSETTKKKLSSFADHSIFIHFDFGGKQWHEHDESFSLVKAQLKKKTTDNTKQGIVPSKSIYRTLCSGDEKNDIQFPLFDYDCRYKSFAFKNDEEFENFLYTETITSKPFRKLYGTDIDFYIYPVLLSSNDSESISAKDYEDFFFEMKNENVLMNTAVDMVKDSFSFFAPIENTKFTKFDFVFADSSGRTVNELLEISGLDKSKLKRIKERHEDIAVKVNAERNLKFESSNEYLLKPENSFTQILGKAVTEVNSKTQKAKVVFVNKTKTSNGLKPVPKYQSHLLKALPLIYMENYFHDEVLLPAFVQNVEYSIRNGDEKYSFLKFHLMFLLKIQNTQNDQYMEITESPSYQIGVKLGKLAKPLKKKINSFEKRYVGLLTRHTSTKDDCIKLSNDINEMLTRHERTWGQMSAEVNEELAQLPLKDYDREKLAFGFFEGYFKYEANDKKKDFFSRLEKLLSDYDGNEELEETVDQFNQLLNQIKTETNS